MATLYLGCLCLVLSIGLTSSRDAAVIHSGSSDPQSWWDQDPLHIGKRALDSRKSGDLHASAAIYHEGYLAALAAREKQAAVRFLMSEAGCDLLQFHYRDALALYLNSRALATSIHDVQDLGAIALNLSSVYLAEWDKAAALRAAEEGLAATPKAGQIYWRAQLLLQIGRIRAQLEESSDSTPSPSSYFMDGIEAARAQGAVPLEAMGWDFLGEQQLTDGQLERAERSLEEAFRLRVLFHVAGDLNYSYARLGALKFKEGALKTALDFTERALTPAARSAASWPEYLLLHQRGQIRLAMNQVDRALTDFSGSLDALARWRLEVLPARSSFSGANIELEQRIFHSFIEVAAAHALRTGDSAWTRKAFQANELNRAASLRESLVFSTTWREKVPAQYWDILGQLAQIESSGRRDDTALTAARRLRLKLTEMEARAGQRFYPKRDEIFASQASLIHFQQGLRASELFLSFFLGDDGSYLWAVSRNSLHLYRLASSPELRARSQAFRESLAGGRASGALNMTEQETVVRGDRAQELYHALFGQLNAGEREKTSWLLSLDGALFDVPFPALVTERQGGKTVYLIEKHSLQTVPGALLLTAAPVNAKAQAQQDRGWFLGVGDPVYNTADPRWRQASWLGTTWPGNTWLGSAWSGGAWANWLGNSANGDRRQLNRLVGSGDEIESSARSWRESGTATVLEGTNAVRERFLALVKSHPPAVLHLATHVLSAGASSEQGLIAFGLTPRSVAGRLGDWVMGRNPPAQFLGTTEVAALHVPGSLVVMTGCSSGVGDAQAGTGLLGLTRAWMMAGAGTVVATAWPVEDNSGEMLARFYGYLETDTAAEALRRTQLDMVHDGTWRSAPVYWASYQVSGGQH